MEKIVSGIVVGSTDYKEADKIISILTPTDGLIRATARGVKKDKAKLKFSAMPFAFCEYTLIKKGDYFLVKSAAQIESLMHIAYDPDAFLVGAVMLEISANASGGTDSTLFISLLEGIKDLIYGDNSAYEIGTRFVLDLLVRGGYQEGDYITSEGMNKERFKSVVHRFEQKFMCKIKSLCSFD